MIVLQHETLINYIKTNYELIKHHNMNMEDIENMFPWERIVYIDYINMKMKEDAMNEQDAIKYQKDMNSLYRKLK